MLRAIWWSARYKFVSWLAWKRLVSTATVIRYSPYICAVRQMCRQQERKQRHWLACRWCDTPRRVDPAKRQDTDDMCWVCWCEWQDHYSRKRNEQMRMSHSHRGMTLMERMAAPPAENCTNVTPAPLADKNIDKRIEPRE